MISFDPAIRSELDKMVRTNFPDSHIDERTLTSLAAALWISKTTSLDLSKYSNELQQLSKDFGLRLVGDAADASIHCTPGPDTAGIRYYEAKADHQRKDPASLGTFTGKLAMARVTLPESQALAIETRLGTVEPGDHLIKTLAQARREYGSEVPYEIGRVDLISPARLGGTRFGAIGVYLGYGDPAAPPRFYVLEAGTATGESRVLFFNEIGDDMINSYSGYQPTPFAHPRHAYVGKLSVEGDNPTRLQITARRVADPKPYILVDVHFQETRNPDVVWPGFHFLRALGIIVSRLPHVPLGQG